MLHSTEPLHEDIASRQMLIRSDLACILVHALKERDAGKGSLPECLGLLPAQLSDLAATWFPGIDLPDLDAPEAEPLADQQAIALLLRWRGGRQTPESFWLSSIIARRALENSHLWEDLGLPSRQALGRLLALHFPKLFAANTQNMRWKKFFYRQICSDADFALCLSPTCDECEEKAECFAPDEGHGAFVY